MKEIWLDDCDSELDPFTDRDLAKVEQQLKVKLPNAYIELMKEKNGFYLSRNWYPSSEPTDWGEAAIQLDSLLGIGLQEGSISENGYLQQEWEVDPKLIIISLNPPEFVCLDYRAHQGDQPPISYINVDTMQDFLLAPNFSEFIRGLHAEEPEEEAVIEASEKYNFDEVIKHYAEIARRGRTDNEIKRDITLTLEDAKPAKVIRLFDETLDLRNANIEEYLVNLVKVHENAKVRENVASYLADCAEGLKLTLEREFVERTLIEMRDDKKKNVRFFVDMGLAFLGIIDIATLDIEVFPRPGVITRKDQEDGNYFIYPGFDEPIARLHIVKMEVESEELWHSIKEKRNYQIGYRWNTHKYATLVSIK
ncbi:SMI1/KNR4 family protein [Bacillus suaedae]|uniref:SMI1/KNR4 family protein n=1 Tax=Halalkalibacter suaedae TaxID=2822140 RepID=A0A941ANE3_9BACI|nr:SMI1/KNR4 family protein [Bacillus suaedae]MBP3950232.1 SMI1/KNR4 family protein [Bacillus suaedae]